MISTGWVHAGLIIWSIPDIVHSLSIHRSSIPGLKNLRILSRRRGIMVQQFKISPNMTKKEIIDKYTALLDAYKDAVQKAKEAEK